jgi:hypothetical protein
VATSVTAEVAYADAIRELGLDPTARIAAAPPVEVKYSYSWGWWLWQAIAVLLLLIGLVVLALWWFWPRPLVPSGVVSIVTTGPATRLGEGARERVDLSALAAGKPVVVFAAREVPGKPTRILPKAGPSQLIFTAEKQGAHRVVTLVRSSGAVVQFYDPGRAGWAGLSAARPLRRGDRFRLGAHEITVE